MHTFMYTPSLFWSSYLKYSGDLDIYMLGYDILVNILMSLAFKSPPQS